MKGYTDEELADLTPQERAALEGDDNDNNGDGENASDNDNDGNDAGGKDGSEGGDGNGDDDPDSNNDNADADANANAEADANADKDANLDDDKQNPDDTGQQASRDDGQDPDKGADPTPAAAQVREHAPVFVAEAPKDSDKHLTEIKTQKSTLADQFDEGDITAKEYQHKLDDLNRQEREIEREIDRARIASDMEEQRKSNSWNDAQSDFLSEHPEYNDATRGQMFNAVFRTVSQREEFHDLPVTRANSLKLLRAAHEAYVVATGGKPAPAKEDKDTTGNNTKAKRTELPQTLSHVPASDVNDTNNGKWAALDSLREKDYEAYEEKLFGMSEKDREAYLVDR